MAKVPGFTHLANKGSQQELLPHRSALTKLAGGDQAQRSINNYSAVTPSGANALSAPSAIDLGKLGTSLER